MMPLFRSRYDLRQLPGLVAAVARVADPGRPAQVSQRAWDAARASAGFADAPTAKQVSARLRLPWRGCLAIALASDLDLDQSLGRRFGEPDDPTLGVEAIRAALRTVALRLKKRTLSIADYTSERREMLSAVRRALLHPGELTLPTEGQIRRVAGSWEQALILAGLEPRPTPAGSKGLSIVEALDLHLEAHGFLPSTRQLERFARAQGFALAKRRRCYADYFSELATARAEWGKWTPAAVPTRGGLPEPDYEADGMLPAAEPRPGRRRKRWTRPECVTALQLFLDELPPGARPTQRRYQEAARKRAEFPSLRSLQTHGAFSELLAEARSAGRTRNS